MSIALLLAATITSAQKNTTKTDTTKNQIELTEVVVSVNKWEMRCLKKLQKLLRLKF